MSRVSRACLVLALVTTACATNDDEPSGGGGDAGAGSGTGDGGSGPGGDGGAGGPIVPHEGVWTYAEVTPVTSTCPSIVDQGGAGDFAITGASAAGFHVIPQDGTDPFDCTLTGASFACANRALRIEQAGTALITTRATSTGTMSSSSVATGRQDATVSCTGAGCAAIPLLPCAFTVSFVVRTL